MSRVLELKDFKYSYGNIEVVHGVDLYVEEGEIVAIIGANGAGKTTTLQSISGLTDSKGVKGQIIFKGKDIAKKSGYSISNLGLAQVLEGRHVFSQLTVEENLDMGSFAKNNKNDTAIGFEYVYNLFPRLYERRKQEAGTLSGGEQQMLAIGRSLLSNPDMILMDEPSLGLAPKIIKDIFKSIETINKEQNMTILLVEQNSKVALNTASRGYVMQNGEITIEGSSNELLNNEEVKKAYLGE